MNWKNVLYLLRVERKSGRLIRGSQSNTLPRKRHTGLLALLACRNHRYSCGVYLLTGSQREYIQTQPQFPGYLLLAMQRWAFSFQCQRLMLILSLVFTMFQQIQLSGIKKTSQSHVLVTRYMAGTHLSIHLI